MGARQWGVLGAAALVAVTAAGCSPDISTEGFDIANAEDTATAALTALKEDNADALEQKWTTLSPDAGCFFTKDNPDAEEVTRELACGPVRRLGAPPENAWDRYSIDLSQTGKGEVRAEVTGVADTATALDTNLFVSATGADPAAPDTAPEPMAPPTDVKDKAVLADELTSVDTALKDLDEPWTLKTPALTMEVTAAADLDVVPAQLLSESGDAGEGEGQPDGHTPPYYAPAEGQQVKAFRVKFSAPDLESAPGGNGWSQNSDISYDTQVTVNTDEQKLAITGGDQGESGSGESDTYTVKCSSLPCKGDRAGEQILLTTTPADKPAQLAATVNGETQAIDLAEGTLESKVSTVDYERSERSRDVNEQLRSKATVKTDEDEDNTYSCTFVVDAKKAHLGSFDPNQGWAPAKKAWLAIELDNLDRNSKNYDCFYFEDYDYGKDMVLKIGKDTVKATNAESSAVLFEVPDDITDTTLSWTPSGTFDRENNPKYRGKAATVKVAFAK